MFGRVEKKFFTDKLQISLGGAIQLVNPKNIKDNHGIILIPEIEYYPYDSVELTLGYFGIWGKGVNNLLSSIKGYDQVYLKLKVSF